MESKKFFDIIPPKKNSFEEKKENKEFFKEREKKEEKKTTLPFFFKILIPVLVLLILTGGVFHFRWSRAEIEIWPKIQTLNLDTKVTIDVKADKPDFLSQIIPGKIFEEEKLISQKFFSSGKALKEEKARGIIRVYNNYHLPQTLMTGTRFQPSTEKVLYFRTIKRNIIPSKKYLDLEVRAEMAGEEYNIGPSTFSIPGLAGTPQYYSIYGKSFSAMAGGFKGEAKQVTKNDLEEAERVVLKKLKDENKDYIKSKIPPDFVLLDGETSQEIIEATSSAPEGSLADSFDFNLKAKLKAIFYKKSDLDNFVKELVDSRFGKNNRDIHRKIDVAYFPELKSLESRENILNLKILVKVYSDIDVPNLKSNLTGKSLKEAQFFLGQLIEINKYKIKFFPFWLTKIPENNEKVVIKILTN